ncbi:MAG: PAS domain S-box protein [Desulfatitalea sp.]|nr:PAS domain S-box protein [Desulfatitalea sp.]
MPPLPHLRHSLAFRLGGMLTALLILALAFWTMLLFHWGSHSVPWSVLMIGFALIAAIIAIAVALVIDRLITQPLRALVAATQQIAQGAPLPAAEPASSHEMGQLHRSLARISQVLDDKKSALRQEHDEFLNLFESVPCLITVQDRNLRLIRYNREFAEKFAPRDDDFCYSAYKGRTEKCENCPVEKTFEDGQSHAFEEKGCNRDGRPIHWLARTAPIRDENGNVVAAMEMSLDVTLSRQLEEQLKASEQRYQAIFSNIPNPVFVLDPDTLSILDCNRSVMPVYGYCREDLKGTSFLEMFEPREREHYTEKIKQEVFIHQARQVNQKGQSLFVDIRSSLTPYPEWEVLLVTTSDITQQIETEQQLIQASKMTTLGEMATGVAHELNQPLSVIKTASSFMLKKIEAEQEVGPDLFENMMYKIDSNVDRASKIIQHMRQFARKAEVELEPTDLNHTARMALEIFSEQLKLKGIQVVKQLEIGLPAIRGNASRLEQVFINLLLNARDAIEECWGDKTDNSPEKIITLITRSEPGYVTASVCDTGTGIPASVKAKIFEPFFTTKTVGKGTGLGLSISYGIVKQHGGTIDAENRQGGGACLTLKIPTHADGAIPRPPAGQRQS